MFIQIVLLLSFTGATVRGQGTTLTLNRQDNGFLGTQVSLECSYAYGGSEGTRRVYFYRDNYEQQGFVQIAHMDIRNEYIVNPSPVWDDRQLQGRASFKMTGRTFVSLIISSIECRDSFEYQCKYHVANQTHDMIIRSQAEPFDANAKPLVPRIGYSPILIMEKESVQFTCQGNVGRPAGNLALFLVKNGQESPLTTNLGPVETVLDSCTFTQSAIASSDFTASDNGRVLVRCKVQQQFADSSHVNQTQPLSVQYGPRNTYIQKSVDEASGVAVNPGSIQVVPVRSDVILKCKTDSNPGASFTWSYILDGTNNTITFNAAELRLSDIQLDRSGQYTCLAANVVKNITLSEKFTFTLYVFQQAVEVSSSPTTQDVTTSTGNTAPKTTTTVEDKTNAGVVVGSSIGSAAIGAGVVLIIVFVIRRRRKEQKQKQLSTSTSPAKLEYEDVTVSPGSEKHSSKRVNSVYENSCDNIYEGPPMAVGDLDTGYYNVPGRATGGGVLANADSPLYEPLAGLSGEGENKGEYSSLQTTGKGDYQTLTEANTVYEKQANYTSLKLGSL